jgi:hypothetical protein
VIISTSPERDASRNGVCPVNRPRQGSAERYIHLRKGGTSLTRMGIHAMIEEERNEIENHFDRPRDHVLERT